MEYDAGPCVCDDGSVSDGGGALHFTPYCGVFFGGSTRGFRGMCLCCVAMCYTARQRTRFFVNLFERSAELDTYLAMTALFEAHMTPIYNGG